MNIDIKTTALVVTDPQNDFLSEDGAAWALVGDSVRENDTIANLETLLTAARDGGYRTFVSPHYYYPADKEWQFGGTLEQKMHKSACSPAVDRWTYPDSKAPGLTGWNDLNRY